MPAGFAGLLVVFLASGLLGAFRYSDSYALYRGFAPPSEPRVTVARRAGQSVTVPVVKGTLQEIFVTSSAIGGRTQPVWVFLPPGYSQNPSQRYPVIYFLHGFPGGPESYIKVGLVWLVQDVLVAQRRMAPMIEVMPLGSPGMFHDEEWANGISPGNGWETFLARDVVGAIDSRYRTIASGEGRAIAGLSEGAYGALNIALHHPLEFDVIESWSGYMLADHIARIFGRNPRVLAENSPMVSVRTAAPVLRADRAYIWFYIGEDDKMLGQNQQFDAELARLSIDHQFFTSSGAHSWALWRMFSGRALMVASDHLAHG